MGYENTRRAFEDWSHLGHREGRLLAYMASCTDDRHEVPVYWAGWAKAASVLGTDPLLKPASAKEVFRQSIAKLRKAGAIVSSGHAGPNFRAVYALTLDPATTALPAISVGDNGQKVIHWEVVPRGERGNESLPHLSNESLPHWGNESLENGATNHCPLKKDKKTIKNGQTTSTQSVNPLAPVDNSESKRNSQYAAAQQFLMKNPETHQHFMDLAGQQLGEDASSQSKVILAAKLAGMKRDAA